MRHFACFIALVIFLLAIPVRATDYSDSSRAFSFTFPEQDPWIPLSDDELEVAVEPFAHHLPIKPFAAFEYPDLGLLALSSGTYPDEARHSTFPLATIEKFASAYTGVHPSLLHSADVPALPPDFDHSRNAPVIPPTLAAGSTQLVTCFTSPPGFVVDYRDYSSLTRSRTYVFLGRDRYVALHFLMHPASYAELRPSFDAISASFRFFSSEATSLAKHPKDPGDYTAFGTYLFVTLLLTAAAVTLYFLFKRRPY